MLFVLIAFSMCLTFMIGIRGFVSLWVGKDNYILSYLTIFLFTTTLFLNILYNPLVALINADGLFKDNKRHIFTCAVINVVLSIILIQFIGINGILLGTAIAFLANIFLKSRTVTLKIFKDKNLLNTLKDFIIVIIIYILLSIALLPVEHYFLITSTSIITTVIKLGIIFILIIGLTSSILYFISDDAKNLFKRIIIMIKRKLKSA